MVAFDDILTEIGTFGRYQIIVALLLAYGELPFGMNEYASIYLAYVPEYRCKIPLFENTTRYPNLTNEQILNLTTPTDSSGMAVDPCVRYGYNLSTCSNGDFSCVNTSEDTIPCDNGYYYDNSLFTNTIVTEFNLVCDREALGYASTSAYLAGNVAGSFVSPVADRFGRRPVMLFSNLGFIVVTLATSFCHSIELYSVGRFLQAFFGSSCFRVAFVHAIEIVGIKWRGFVGMVYQTFYIIGFMLWSVVAYIWRDWHQLQFAMFVMQLPFTVCSLLIPESARWLFSKKKFGQGKKVSETMARLNGKCLSAELWTEAISMESSQSSFDITNPAYSILDLFRTPGIRKTILKYCCISFVFGLVYYGVGLNLGSLGGNLFLNNLLGGVLELSSYVFCALILNYTGRRPLLVVLFLICSVCLATYTVLREIAEDTEPFTTVCTVLVQIGKACIGGAFAVGISFAAELFPTVIRNTATAVGAVAGQIGAIVGPSFMLLQNDFPWLPNCIFAILSVMASVVTLSLPETNGQALTETIEEAELFYAGKPYGNRETKQADDERDANQCKKTSIINSKDRRP